MRLLVLLLVCSPVSWLSEAQEQNPVRDFFDVSPISPAAGTRMEGRTAAFRVKVKYDLKTRDRALLSVFAERYWGTPQGCSPRAQHQTEGGTQALLQKGPGETEVTFTWVGDAPRSPVPEEPSFIGLGMRLWSEKDGKAVPPAGPGHITQYCYPVGPAAAKTGGEKPQE